MDRSQNGSAHTTVSKRAFAYKDSGLSKWAKPLCSGYITVPAGKIICSDNEVPECCYYIVYGRVLNCIYTESGRKNIIVGFGPGTLLFDISLILGVPIGSTFETLTECSFGIIRKMDLINAFDNTPGFAKEMYRSLARVFLALNGQNAAARHNCEWRICSLLKDLANTCGEEFDGRTLLNHRITQQTLADRLSTSRATIIRITKKLRSIGLLDVINGCYCFSVAELETHMDSLD